MFQAYNTERYCQIMISIEIQRNEYWSQKITKRYHWVELQGLGYEALLREYVRFISWKRNKWDNDAGTKKYV